MIIKKIMFVFALLFYSKNLLLANNSKYLQHQYGFAENKGQLVDQNNHPNKSVKYLFHSNGFNIQLLSNSFSYDTYTSNTKSKLQYESSQLKSKTIDKLTFPNEKLHFHRIDIEFIDANQSPEIISEQELEGYTNYYTTGTPKEGILYVRSYQKITYKNLYNGIDLQFIVNDSGQVEYNFIIHPNADASKVKWKYKGANDIIVKNNKIIIELSQGRFEERIPLSYFAENHERVNIKYVALGNNEFGFSIPALAHKKSTLIIDPVPWATYYGANLGDVGMDITKDVSGNLLITGYTNSTSVIASTGAYQVNFGGDQDAFIVKFNSTGSRLWGTYYGGSGFDIGYSISKDNSSNIFIAGVTNSDSILATSGAYQLAINGGVNYDAFIAKFNLAGIRQWGTYYGGSSDEYAYGIANDTFGSVYITGYTESTTGMHTSGAYDTIYSGNKDAFIAKFNATGTTRISATYYGGGDWDQGYGIAIDRNGNILMTGVTTSTTGIGISGSYQPTYGGGWRDAFVVKFNPLCVPLWGTYYGGSGEDWGRDITNDGNNNVCVTGWTTSTTSIASSLVINDTITSYAGHQTIYGGGNSTYGDAFVVKFTPSGNRIWGTYYGGSGWDWGIGITTDATQNILFIGKTQSSNNIASTGAYQTSLIGTDDAFFVKFTPVGLRLFATYFGGGTQDYGYSIVTNDSSIFICGATNSISGVATSGAYQTARGGGIDMFLAAFTSGGILPVSIFDISAHKTRNNVIINWTTAQEINSNVFEIERMIQSSNYMDARISVWKKIGDIKAAENSNSFKNYEFIDQAASNNKIVTIFYRLKIIDNDGNFSYSKIVSINLFDEFEEKVEVFPNPFYDDLTIKINSSNNSNAILEIKDITGKILFFESIPLFSGNSYYNLKCEQTLQAGIYLVCITTQSNKQTFIKVIKY